MGGDRWRAEFFSFSNLEKSSKFFQNLEESMYVRKYNIYIIKNINMNYADSIGIAASSYQTRYGISSQKVPNGFKVWMLRGKHLWYIADIFQIYSSSSS